MTFDFGYLVSVNPAAGYANQYNAILINEMQKKIKHLEKANSMDDYEKGYVALMEGDTKKAIRLWEKEAQLGVSEAQIALGDLYHHRLKDLDKAVKHYGLAYELGETKAGALVFAAKLSLGKLESKDLESASQDIRDEPWYKYVEVSLALKQSGYTSFILDDELIDKNLDKLLLAIKGGVLPAITLAITISTMGSFLNLYQNSQELHQPLEELNEMLEIATENGEILAAELYILWLLSTGSYTNLINFARKFESQFELPDDKSREILGLTLAVLLLPLQEKSLAKKLFGGTKSVSVGLGSSLLDSFSSDWEIYEEFLKKLIHSPIKSEKLEVVLETIDRHGVVEARRYLALSFIEWAFSGDEVSGTFGSGEDYVFLDLYYFLSLSKLCIEGWKDAEEKSKADTEFTPFIPVLEDFVDAFFGSTEEFERRWNVGPVELDSSKAEYFISTWLPYFREKFGHLQLVRARTNES